MVATTTIRQNVNFVTLSSGIVVKKVMLHQCVTVSQLTNHQENHNQVALAVTHPKVLSGSHNDSEGSQEELHICTLTNSSHPLHDNLLLNGTEVRMEVDSGAVSQSSPRLNSKHFFQIYPYSSPD